MTFENIFALPKPHILTSHFDILTSFDLDSPPLAWSKAEHRAAHDDGETATARAAAKAGVLMAVSSSATTCLEDVVAAGGPALKRWFQLSLSSRKVSDFTKYLSAAMT